MRLRGRDRPRRLRLPFLLAVIALVPTGSQAQDYDEIRRLLNDEQFSEANRIAKIERATNPRTRKLEWIWARTVQGMGWERQVRSGFDSAVRPLERNLGAHEVIEYWYALTCEWAGMEERGIEKLRQSALPEAQRIDPELRLLTLLRRYEEADARAREVEFDGREGWLEWIGTEAAKRARLESRARRAWIVFGAALVGFGFVVAILFRSFRSSRPSPSPAPSGSRS